MPSSGRRRSPPGRPPTRFDPAAALDGAEARRAVNAAVAGQMPEPEREVILLAYRDNLTQSEIAGRLSLPLGTVKTRTRRALARLRGALAEIYGPTLAPVPVGPGTETADMLTDATDTGADR